MTTTQVMVRLTYQKFGYFLMFLLAIAIMFNGTSAISNWVAVPLISLITLGALVVMVVVEFNEGPETIWTKFLSRFTKLDVLIACVLIIVYIAGCNDWLNMID